MKLALISPLADPWAGYGTITYNLCRALFDRGVDFRLFLPHGHGRVKAPWAERIERSLPAPYVAYDSPRFLATRLAGTERFRGFDLIHSLFALPQAHIACRAARRFDVPFVLGAQGTYGIVPFLGRASRALHSRVLDRADRIIVPSEFTRSAILSFYDGNRLEERIAVINNGVDYARFAAARTKEPHGSRSPRFVGVGGLKTRKGFHICIKAMAEVVRRHPEARYDIIGGGEGPYVQGLRSQIAALGLERNVHLLGAVDNTRLPKLMGAAFAYIHTPICADWNFEGFGITYLEANACGLPAIGSRSGGVPDAIRDGVTGLLCRERDPESAAACMINLIESESRYTEMRNNAIAWAREHDWSVVAGRFIACYERVLRG